MSSMVLIYFNPEFNRANLVSFAGVLEGFSMTKGLTYVHVLTSDRNNDSLKQLSILCYKFGVSLFIDEIRDKRVGYAMVALRLLRSNAEQVYFRDVGLMSLFSRLLKLGLFKGIKLYFEHHTLLSSKAIVRLNHFSFHGGYFVGITAKQRDILLDLGLEATNRMIFLPSAIDGSWLNASKKHLVKKYDIIYSGGFYQGRGLNKLLELATKRSDIIVLFCGGTILELEKISGFSEVASLENVVVEPYSKDRGHLQKLVRSSRIGWVYYEESSKDISGQMIGAFQSPLKLVEYQAVGLHILCSNLPGIKETCSNYPKAHFVSDKTEIEKVVDTVNSLEYEENTVSSVLTWQQRCSKILEL